MQRCSAWLVQECCTMQCLLIIIQEERDDTNKYIEILHFLHPPLTISGGCRKCRKFKIRIGSCQQQPHYLSGFQVGYLFNSCIFKPITSLQYALYQDINLLPSLYLKENTDTDSQIVNQPAFVIVLVHVKRFYKISFVTY